jgi:hypothetical protein
MAMKDFFRSRKLQIIFTLAGAVGGFLYWKFVGCTSGTCAIKSVWYWSTLWGSAVGYLVGDFIADIVERRNKRGEDTDERKISEHH